MPRTWPEDWDARRNGLGCPKCAEGRPGEDLWGVRFFAGRWADAYLERRPPQPGTAVVTFRGSRHVADPCDFTDEELAGYWFDVRTAAKAIERAYRPCQLNYGTFGNAVPHVHTHITPRYPDDPAPGRPLPDWVFANAPALEPDQLAEQIARLRHHLPRSVPTMRKRLLPTISRRAHWKASFQVGLSASRLESAPATMMGTPGATAAVTVAKRWQSRRQPVILRAVLTAAPCCAAVTASWW